MNKTMKPTLLSILFFITTAAFGQYCAIYPTTQQICTLGEPAVFTAYFYGGTPPFIYQWTGPNGFSSGGRRIRVTQPGNYSVVIIDSRYYTTACSTALTVVPPPVCSVEPASQVICTNQTATFTAKIDNGIGPFIYQWTGPRGFNENTEAISVSVPGSYSVVAIDLGSYPYCTTACSAALLVKPCDKQ